MSKHSIIPIFVPHLGCPHDCVFCNQRKITNQENKFSISQVEETIERYLGYFKNKTPIEIAFYGGSFTAIDIELQKQLLNIAAGYREKGMIDEIRLSTRPDAINMEILNHLKYYGVNTIELGVQSLDDQVLMASGRGHLKSHVYQAVNLIKSYGFKLGLQMMIGLPKDSPTITLNTAKEFVRMKPDCIRIYPTLVIKDTFLEKMTDLNKYIPLSLGEAVERVTPILIYFYIKNMNVIRVGLQATENIQLGYDVISGPFHPAFRQLVETNIYKYILDYYLNDKDIKGSDHLELVLNEKNISDLAGQNSSNLNYFYKKYNFKNIKIKSAKTKEHIMEIRFNGSVERLNILEILEIVFNKLEKSINRGV